MDKVPPALADVAEPLREADEYTRLQAIRQRGFYNLVTGAPMFFWVVPPVILALVRAASWGDRSTGSHPSVAAWTLVIYALQWTLFALSCFPKTFLPVVRRRRPDWQSPLLQADLLKNSLEKQFWFQLPFHLLYTVVTPLLLVFGALDIFHGVDPVRFAPGLDHAAQVMAATHVVLSLAMATTLAWRSNRQGDRLLALAFLAWIPVLVAAPFLDSGQLPSLLAITVFSFALTLPAFFAGLYRLLAPRRWLVR